MCGKKGRQETILSQFFDFIMIKKNIDSLPIADSFQTVNKTIKFFKDFFSLLPSRRDRTLLESPCPSSTVEMRFLFKSAFRDNEE